MRAKKRDLHLLPARRISKQDAALESSHRRTRLPLPVIRTGRPATLELTNKKVDEILLADALRTL
jgi:hypothetical protein